MDSFVVVVMLGLLFFLCVAIALVAFLGYQYFSLKAQVNTRLEHEREIWREKELGPTLRAQADLSRQEAQAQLKQWREQELELARKQQLEVARSEAQMQLEQWRKEQEQAIRQDAIQRSQSVTVGKVTEHIVPYLPGFAFNPKDARFVGSPIDLVIFDGLSEGEGNVKSIVFIEIKTGASALSTRERRVRDAIQAGRVQWMELRPAVDVNRVVTDGHSEQAAGLGECEAQV
jgi:predicted Holliday junction resolvase-like endonuclease